MREVDPHEAVDYILIHGKRFAKARAERTYIEEYRKSLKAILMKSSGEKVIAAQERDAYAHHDYLQLLDGLRAAVEVEEKLRWDLIGAQARVEIFKVQEYTKRQEMKVL
jgi:hypothetical protein